MVTKNVTYHVKEYACKHCKEQMTTNGNGKLTLLTPKYKEINSVLEKIHKNRLRKRHIETLDLSENPLFRIAN